jgi:hypothetical protein
LVLLPFPHLSSSFSLFFLPFDATPPMPFWATEKIWLPLDNGVSRMAVEKKNFCCHPTHPHH